MASGSNGDNRKTRLAEYRRRLTAAGRRALANTRRVDVPVVPF